ncbi:MAG: mechanosensitive ion channel family protein, partial [Erysipelotrichaceae bacterium]
NQLQNHYFEAGFLGFLFTTSCILIIAIIVSKLLKKVILHGGKKETSLMIRIKNIIVYGFAFYAILMQIKPLQRLGVTLLASGGALTVVFGLAAQEALSNFVSGIIIMMFKPFKIGDLIKINNSEYTGIVYDISVRHTVIETFEKTKIIIPNAEMNKAVLENVSQTGCKGNYLDVYINYQTDIDLAMDIINEEVKNHQYFKDVRSSQDIENHEPLVTTRLIEFKESTLHLRTTVFSDDNATGFAMLSDLRIAIKKHFDQAGIVAPYPQVVINEKQVQK